WLARMSSAPSRRQRPAPRSAGASCPGTARRAGRARRQWAPGTQEPARSRRRPRPDPRAPRPASRSILAECRERPSSIVLLVTRSGSPLLFLRDDVADVRGVGLALERGLVLAVAFFLVVGVGAFPVDRDI